MWNPSENIEDLMAAGFSRAEAVAETRAEAQKRREVLKRSRLEQARRRNDDRPRVLNLVNQYQRKRKEE